MVNATPRAPRPSWTRAKCAAHGVAQAVHLPRRVGRGLDAFGLLAVEDPQRIVAKSVPVLIAQPVGPGREEDLELGAVGRTASSVAERVEPKAHLPQPDLGVEAGEKGDHLDVEERVLSPECLHVQLVVLAVAAGLGPLVAEGRRHRPDLPGHRRAVLHECPHDARGHLRPQRQVTRRVALVEEVVHLLAHDVGRLPDPLEDPDVLEHRVDDQAVPARLHPLRKPGDQRLVGARVRGEDVERALGGLEGLGHGSPSLPAEHPRSGSRSGSASPARGAARAQRPPLGELLGLSPSRGGPGRRRRRCRPA